MRYSHRSAPRARVVLVPSAVQDHRLSVPEPEGRGARPASREWVEILTWDLQDLWANTMVSGLHLYRTLADRGQSEKMQFQCASPGVRLGEDRIDKSYAWSTTRWRLRPLRWGRADTPCRGYRIPRPPDRTRGSSTSHRRLWKHRRLRGP